MKSFDIKVKIHFGEKSLDRLAQLTYNRVLVIADPFVVSSGLIHHIDRRLQKAELEYKIFSEVVPDPPLEKITLGVVEVIEYKPECIIAVGGGSAIDSAKAIRSVAATSGKLENKIDLIAIPTTSGTGSEVTSFAVVTDTENKTKIPLVSDEMLPQEAILDADLVTSVPPNITADTGMDVFTHALESYVSTESNEFTAALAEKAIEFVGAFLLRSYLDSNDYHARSKMHCASCLAGLAFNASNLGLNHGMAHQLGAFFHIPHGRANALLLPYIIEYNSNIDKRSRSQDNYPKQVKKYVTVARMLGLQNFNTITTISALVSWIRFMMVEMDMPHSISEIGCCTEQEYFAAIPDMAQAALEDSTTITNPRKPTKQDIEELYTKIW